MVAAGWDNRQVTSISNPNPAFKQILSALPHTQCTRCGFADCAGYAQAIASGNAAINQCPPGGAEGIERLSHITGLPVQPLNPVNGVEGPRSVAVIDEAWCIGCTLCIKACPVDAIIGSNRQVHTVIEPCCTGCALCLPVCPVDCISLENVTGTLTGWSAWSADAARTAQKRYAFHIYKASPGLHNTIETPEKSEIPEVGLQTEPARQGFDSHADGAEAARKNAAISAALARSRRQRQLPP